MPDLTFGDYPVTTKNLGSDVLINCKGVTGTLSQLTAWLDNHANDPYAKFQFGMGSKISDIIIDGTNVKIACLQEDYSTFKKKISILKKQNND
jgi:hypothetical protein